jgi:hypothetical protein
LRDAIATVEIFVRPSAREGAGALEELRLEAAAARGEKARRLTLVISKPERDRGGRRWLCRLALADLHRPVTISAPDSILVLERALAQARGWLAELESKGWALWRDREGTVPFVLK